MSRPITLKPEGAGSRPGASSEPARPLRVLAPAALREWSRGLFGERATESDTERCGAIVVLNDQGPEVVPLLQAALALRAERPGLPVAVLTRIPDDARGLDALVLGLSGGQAVAAICAERLPVTVRHGGRAISFEYDA